MAPHLMTAQSAYKADKHATPTNAHTHKHPHTPTATRARTRAHTHTPVSYTHLTLPTIMVV